jgi:hypothetical protein
MDDTLRERSSVMTPALLRPGKDNLSAEQQRLNRKFVQILEQKARKSQGWQSEP